MEDRINHFIEEKRIVVLNENGEYSNVPLLGKTWHFGTGMLREAALVALTTNYEIVLVAFTETNRINRFLVHINGINCGALKASYIRGGNPGVEFSSNDVKSVGTGSSSRLPGLVKKFFKPVKFSEHLARIKSVADSYLRQETHTLRHRRSEYTSKLYPVAMNFVLWQAQLSAFVDQLSADHKELFSKMIDSLELSKRLDAFTKGMVLVMKFGGKYHMTTMVANAPHVQLEEEDNEEIFGRIAVLNMNPLRTYLPGVGYKVANDSYCINLTTD